ncbi:MAG: hypothetical protein K0U74_17215 [Alphaproteobacteria bacterium]|nr:hypothetical protein [Alphaproteobacteria bacterium]
MAKPLALGGGNSSMVVWVTSQPAKKPRRTIAVPRGFATAHSVADDAIRSFPPLSCRVVIEL